jgi:lysophospholipase L1-like esterase
MKPASTGTQYIFGLGAITRALVFVDTYWEANESNVTLSSGLVASTTDYGIYTATGYTTGQRPGVAMTFNGKYSHRQQNKNGTTWSAASSTTAHLGSYQGAAGSNYTGDTRCVLLFDKVLSDTEFKRVVNWLAVKYGLKTLQSVPTHNIVIDGNSLSVGYGTTPANIDKAVENLAATRRVTNLGITGQRTSTMQTNYAAKVVPLFREAACGKNILCVWEGTNDVYFGASATAAYNNLVAYCQAAQATGWKVAVGTLLPRQDAGVPAGFETDRLAVNVNIRTNYATFADALMDIGADASLQDPTNTTYFNGDKVHLTTTGYALVYPYFLTAIAALS